MYSEIYLNVFIQVFQNEFLKYISKSIQKYAWSILAISKMFRYIFQSV